MKTRDRLLRKVPFGFAVLVLIAVNLIGCGSDNDSDPVPLVPDIPSSDQITKAAILTGAQETPSVTTSATGFGSVVVNSTTRAISGEFNFTGVTATAAHIHTGAAGVAGAPAITLTVDNANFSATVPAGTVLNQTQYDDLMAGNLYVNVHSATNPGGEIRGQLGRIVMTATLNGGQETPAVVTAANGTGRVVVDPETRGISGGITFSGVVATAAHIHTAAAGIAGPVAITLTLGVESATVPAGTVLTQQQYDDLLAGKLYFNVHSISNPGGEIRGQIGPVAMVAMLDGAQEVPAVTTAATGQGVMVVDPVTRAMSGGVVFSGVVPTASHIHTGAPGVSGGIAVPLTLGAGGISAVVPPGTLLTQEQYDDLVAGNLYVNVHSAANPGGEIRGQLETP